MVRNICLLGGNSHPLLTECIANTLGIPPCNRILTKFSGGESRCEIKDSVRGKDVYIVQSASGSVNDSLIELCIMISACKTGSAKRVTAVVPLFPYSRQPDWPYNKAGAPLSGSIGAPPKRDYTFESVPATPRPGGPRSIGITNSSMNGLAEKLSKSGIHNEYFPPRRSDTSTSFASTTSSGSHYTQPSITSQPSFTTHDHQKSAANVGFQAKPGYKQWVALAGTLVADLLTCAGADHIITMDLHDPQYQGFFDIPVDNLYGKPLIQNYIQQHIPEYRGAVVVSPDAGGAKRASLIRDSLDIDFALIHKVGSCASLSCFNTHRQTPYRNVVLSSLRSTATPA